MVYRIYVEKKHGFDGEAQGLFHELVDLLGITRLTGLRLAAVYCLVWFGRRSDNLHDCVQRNLYHYFEHHCRRSGYQQGFLQRGKKYGRQYLGYY